MRVTSESPLSTSAFNGNFSQIATWRKEEDLVGINQVVYMTQFCTTTNQQLPTLIPTFNITFLVHPFMFNAICWWCCLLCKKSLLSDAYTMATPQAEIDRQHEEAKSLVKSGLACAERVNHGEIPLEWKQRPTADLFPDDDNNSSPSSSSSSSTTTTSPNNNNNLQLCWNVSLGPW